MTEAQPVSLPDHSFLGRLWEGRRMEMMTTLGSVSFAYYRRFVGNIEAAGGIDEFSYQHNLTSTCVREMLITLSCQHAYPLVGGRLSHERSQARFPVIQKALFHVFEITVDQQPNFSCLLEHDSFATIFSAPLYPYELSGNLREVMMIELFLNDQDVWSLYDYIARSRTESLIASWGSGEDVHAISMLQVITRGAVQLSTATKQFIFEACTAPTRTRDQQILLEALRVFIYRDQLRYLLITLGSQFFGSRRIGGVLEGKLLSSDDRSFPGIALGNDGNLYDVDLCTEAEFLLEIKERLGSVR